MKLNILQPLFLLAIFSTAPGVLAAPCPTDVKSLIQTGSTESMSPVNYKVVAYALKMRKSDFISSQELDFNDGPLIPFLKKQGFDKFMTPGDPASAKRINSTSLLTKDDPPVEIPMIGLKQVERHECVAYDPSSNSLIRLTRRIIYWKVKGTSHKVTTSTNSYDGFKLFTASDF